MYGNDTFTILTMMGR